MGSAMCGWTYLIFLLFITNAFAQHFHSHINHFPRQHNRGYYTQHTTFTNPLLHHHQSSQIPPSRPGFYPSASRHHVGPGLYHQYPQQHYFSEFLGGGDLNRIPFRAPLFNPANSLETAESSGQVVNYNKALQEILEEQFGNNVGGNDSNNGFNNGGGDQLNFNGDVLGGLSYVRVQQSFGDRKSNYNYQVAV